MIEYLKLKNYKGIKEVKLEHLKLINVLCGKNNSGKSSVLESIVIKDSCVLGKKLAEIDLKWWIDKTNSVIAGFTSPDPRHYKQWFGEEIKSHTGNVFYQDEANNKKEEFLKRLSPYLSQYGKGGPYLAFQKFIEEFINATCLPFSPVLILPKRILETTVQINVDQPITPEGKGILNRLFFLQNQAANSKENNIYKEIYKIFSEVTDGYYFSINSVSGNHAKIFFSKDETHWINGTACGLGLQDVLIMLSFIIDTTYNFIMIEEPESHIHPDMQRRLIRFIKERKDKQFLLSTHSNIFLNTDFADKIFYTEMNDQVTISDETSRANILINLGYSVVDNLVSDLIILTEGPYDIPILKTIIGKLGFLHKYNINFLPVGGDAMRHLDPTCLTEHNTVVAIIDNDPQSKRNRDAFEKKCKETNIPCHKLKRYSIENYFSLPAIRKIYPHQEIDTSLTSLEPDKDVESQLGFSPKGLGNDIVNSMSIEELKGTDLLNFCESIEKVITKN